MHIGGVVRNFRAGDLITRSTSYVRHNLPALALVFSRPMTRRRSSQVVAPVVCKKARKNVSPMSTGYNGRLDCGMLLDDLMKTFLMVRRK
jgi:hypothetical protein